MGTDTPISPDSETTTEVTPLVAQETGEAAPAVDSTPETAPAMAEQADAAGFLAEETAADELPPVEEEMPLPARKSNMRIILLAAVFVLAIAVFAVVFYVFGSDSSSDDVASTPPPVTSRPAPATPPATTPTTAPPATAPTTVPPATLAPPPATMTPPVIPPAPVKPTLPRPAAPAIAQPIQSSAAVIDPFIGGPAPPKLAKLRLKHIRMADLGAALDDAKVEVSLTHGVKDDEVLLIGPLAQLNRAKTILGRLDVAPSPVIVASALPASIPTPTQDYTPGGEIIYPPIPLNPPPGRHAGWIYNNVNGQVFAIFESRTGYAYRVKVGDLVDGMQVMSISPDTLVLRDRQGQEYRLNLQGAESFQTGRSITAVPAAGGPNMPAWR